MMAVEVGAEGELGAPVQLFNEPYWIFTGPFARSYDVASDGRFLMVQPAGVGEEGNASSIVVVQNWFEELKRAVPTE
jgi:hypothetical protein